MVSEAFILFSSEVSAAEQMRGRHPTSSQLLPPMSFPSPYQLLIPNAQVGCAIS
jgi:hypothetical protein